ncbi:MAG: ABC transporter [Actinobacteria bacterium]|nr:MAG: ABC transporter [Actinomycetota bacterium]
MTHIVEATQLRKSYGHHEAVSGVDFAIPAGTIFGLIGPNGAGKTTILRMLVDIIRPSGGSLSVLGVDPRHSSPELRRRIGYLPGELRLNERITGSIFLKRLIAHSGPVRSGHIEQLAERLGVDLTRPMRKLSKGNKQKIGLIQAFMHEPELLLLDEPTSGLDPLVQKEFLTMIREARDNGQTVLLSSHVLSEIQHSADTVAVLAQGAIIAEGAVADLRLKGKVQVRSLVSTENPRSLERACNAAEAVTSSSLVTTGAQGVYSFSAEVNGDIDPLIKELAQHTVLDLVVEEPNLEESVLALYEEKTQ